MRVIEGFILSQCTFPGLNPRHWVSKGRTTPKNKDIRTPSLDWCRSSVEVIGAALNSIPLYNVVILGEPLANRDGERGDWKGHRHSGHVELKDLEIPFLLHPSSLSQQSDSADTKFSLSRDALDFSCFCTTKHIC